MTPNHDLLYYARQERDLLSARIDAALAVHAEDDERCAYCRHPTGDGEYASPPWPCPTVAALTGEDPTR